MAKCWKPCVSGGTIIYDMTIDGSNNPTSADNQQERLLSAEIKNIVAHNRILRDYTPSSSITEDEDIVHAL